MCMYMYIYILLFLKPYLIFVLQYNYIFHIYSRYDGNSFQSVSKNQYTLQIIQFKSKEYAWIFLQEDIKLADHEKVLYTANH